MRIQSWDTAIKAGKTNDASACATFEQRDGNHYLIDMLTIKAEYPLLKRTVIEHAEQYQTDVILIEDKASGQSLLQDLKRDTHLPLVAIMPKSDKVSRLAQASALVEAGKVFLPYAAPWLEAFEAEIMGFPNLPHDDQVDAFSQYIGWVLHRQSRAKPLIRRV